MYLLCYNIIYSRLTNLSTGRRKGVATMSRPLAVPREIKDQVIVYWIAGPLMLILSLGAAILHLVWASSPWQPVWASVICLASPAVVLASLIAMFFVKPQRVPLNSRKIPGAVVVYTWQDGTPYLWDESTAHASIRWQDVRGTLLCVAMWATAISTLAVAIAH
jgi:hypothetical protein